MKRGFRLARVPLLVLSSLLLLAACTEGDASTPTPLLAAGEACPVTVPPDPGFTPPSDWMPDPRSDYDAIWYGDERLWTMLDPHGAPWGKRGFLKHFFFSTAFDPIEEPEPALGLVLRRLDGDDVVEYPGPISHGIRPHGELHEFMIGGAKMTPGCWEITATYRDATLSFVALVVEDPS